MWGVSEQPILKRIALLCQAMDDNELKASESGSATQVASSYRKATNKRSVVVKTVFAAQLSAGSTNDLVCSAHPQVLPAGFMRGKSLAAMPPTAAIPGTAARALFAPGSSLASLREIRKQGKGNPASSASVSQSVSGFTARGPDIVFESSNPLYRSAQAV